MKNFYRLLLIFPLYFQVSVIAQDIAAQNPDTARIPEKLDVYLTSANRAFRFNGSALVAQKGHVLLQKGYGLRKVETADPNTNDTRFPILSITKPFTAIVILKLQEEGKLNVEDKLSRYFPDFPNGNKIKIHHLLTHTSGIYNYTDPIDIEDSALVCYPVPKQKILDLFVNGPVEFSPGKHYYYNNSGYFLLGLIVEKVTGKAFETVVREMIFHPLEMIHSGFDFNNLPDKLKARGYQFVDAERSVPYKHFDSTFAYSAGGIYSTTGDMYKWAEAVSAKQILTPDSWKLAFTPEKNNYAYGWQTGQFFGKNYVKHSGGYPGYMSEFIHYPAEDLTIILLNNFGTYDQTIWPVAMGIFSIVSNLPYDDWKLRKKTNLDSKVLSAYTGTYALNKRQNITISLDGSELFTHINDLPPMRLQAEDSTRFYLENFNTEYNFITDEAGKVSKLIVHEHGRDYELIKK